MKKYLPLTFLFFIYITVCSCHKKSTITTLKNDSSISTILHQDNSNKPTLLLIKNDQCGACKIFYNYVHKNFDSVILPKLPDGTHVYQISINDFNNQNMWLFHISNSYAFPTVLYIDKNNNIKGIHKGADLYSFTDFLNTLKNPDKTSNSNDLKKQSTLLKGYVALIEDHAIPKPLFNEISKINHQKPEFMGALLEAYFYKYEKIHPERVTYIKELLQKSLKTSNQFYNIHQKLINDL